MKFGRFAIADAEGAVLAHSVLHPEGVINKGELLGPEQVRTLRRLDVEHVYGARLEPDDVGEDAAADAVANRLAAVEVSATRASRGRVYLKAAADGVVRLNVDALHAANAVHEGITIATVAPYARAAGGQRIATVKIIPFAVARASLDGVLRALGTGGPAIGLAPFRAAEAGLVLTRLTHTKESLIEKGARAIESRLEALGSRLGAVAAVPHEEEAIRAAILDQHSRGLSPLLVLGAAAIADRNDVVPAALVRAGGSVSHLGMPAEPGNLMMLGALGDSPVVGVPSCARSPKLNGFDWILERLLAGLTPSPADIARMGVGGLFL